MSESSQKRSEEFLGISGQFKLGSLTTESAHPVTAELSQAAERDVSQALKLLFDVDDDVLRKYGEFVEQGRAREISLFILQVLRNGGKLFFTGCGSTGRLSIQLVSIWRDFWQRQRGRGLVCTPSTQELENRALSVMAGGDFALIKAVEGFEDFAEFGKKQLGDLGVSARDMVFAITEGGETSFVIGTAWKGVEVGAKVIFIYNNPDSVLCQYVERSREIIEEARIHKINLTTGPMAITGSTRMQATTIQLCVMLTLLEMVLRELMRELEPEPCALDASNVPTQFLRGLELMHTELKSARVRDQLARLVELEESVYRVGHKNNYFAGCFGIDVLTDTTERSPTFCTPSFRKFDDLSATESWAFLFVPYEESERAWEGIIKRAPKCIDWSEAEVKALVGSDQVARTTGIVQKISRYELMRFKVGLDGISHRPLGEGGSAIGIISAEEKDSLLSPEGFYRAQLESARRAGAKTGLLYLGPADSLPEIEGFVRGWAPDCVAVLLAVPGTDFLLDGVIRVGLKMVLNALSTCTMVRLGRVMGNYMVWVVPSNLKLIDRATRYIQKLAGLEYPAANRLLFEVIEYVEPRMKSDQAYPPVVGLAVMRARHGIGNEEAEKRLREGLGG